MLHFSFKQNCKLLFLLLLLLFSSMSIYMSHGLVETYCKNGHESLFKYVLNNNKKILIKSKNTLNKLKAFFYKIIKLSKIQLTVKSIISIIFQIFNLRFCIISIVFLFSFLFSFFNAGKYKQNILFSNMTA